MSGGLGGGLGGVGGGLLGALLAPETFGLSIPLGGALGGLLGGVGGNLLGDAVGGQKVDPLGLALSGVGGAAGGALGGELLGGVGGATAAGAADPFATGAASTFDATGGAGPAFLGGSTSLGDATGGGLVNSLGSGIDTGASGTSVGADLLQSGAGSALPGGVDPGTARLIEEGAPTALSGGDTSVPNSVLAPGTGVGGATASSGAPQDFGFADLSGAFGGLGGGAAPTAADFSGGAGGIGGNIMNWLKSNKDWLLPGALALNVGKQIALPSQTPGAADISSNAALARQIAQQNASGLNQAQSTAFSQNLEATKNAIRAKYANLGLSGSTAEMQDLNNAALNNTGAQAQAITGNVNSALGAIGASDQATQQLANQQIADDQQLQQAIMALALASAWGLSQK